MNRPALAAHVFLAFLIPAIAASSAEQKAPAPDLPVDVHIVEHSVGAGKTIVPGAYVVLHYVGFVYDPAASDNKGHRFVSSRERGEALSYKYGLKRAIPGFEKGLRGMKVGGTRTIVVPARLAYDDLKYPRPKDVPPDSALVFDVELFDVVPESAPPQE